MCFIDTCQEHWLQVLSLAQPCSSCVFSVGNDDDEGTDQGKGAKISSINLKFSGSIVSGKSLPFLLAETPDAADHSSLGGYVAKPAIVCP